MTDKLRKAVDAAVQKIEKQRKAITSATERLRTNTQRHNPYLFKSVEEFLASPSFQGSERIKMHHHFDQWLYVGAYRAFSKEEIIEGDLTMKLKIGFTTNIRQREASLNSDTHYKLKIVYSWPIPNAKLFELQALRYFKHFIHKDAFENNRIIENTEVVWSLDLYTVVKILRLIILKYAILNDFIQYDQDVKIFFKNFMANEPTGIQINRKSIFANFLYNDITENIDNLYNEIKSFWLINIDDRNFYSKTLNNWRRTFYDSDLTYVIYSTDNIPNEFSLECGDCTFAVYSEDSDDQRYPMKLLGFGVGPYEGAFFIQWLKYDNITFQPDPSLQPYNGDYPAEQFIRPEDIRIGVQVIAGLPFKLRL